MDRRHVAACNDSDVSQLHSGRDEESYRGDSVYTSVGDSCVNMIAPVLVHESSNLTMRGSNRRSSNTQRDNLNGGSVQMASPLGAGTGTIASSAHRRRSMRHKGSLVNLSRHAYTRCGAQLLQLDGDTGSIEMQAASQYLLDAVKLREKYKAVDKGQQEGTERLAPPVVLTFESGYIRFSDQRTQPVSWEQFYDDVTSLYAILRHPLCRRACSQRLQVLEEKYNLYKLCSVDAENSDRYRCSGGVYADCTKVDNGVYLAAIMNAQRLVDYIHETLEQAEDDVVCLTGEENDPQTLRSICGQLDLSDPAYLTVDGLGLAPPNEKRLCRYDVLDPELNYAGRNCAEFLRLFLTPDTVNKGQYFADVVKPILAENDRRHRCIQATESIIEMYGVTPEDWEKMANWAYENGLTEHKHNQWLIALPRKQIRKMTTKETLEHYQQHFENLFLPLFMATLAPEDPKNTQVALFLSHIGGFVLVSDEEECETEFQRKPRRPAEVQWSENVCDLYYAYNIWANLCSLNAFRRRKGLGTLQLRAIANERSSRLDVPVYSYLLCDSIVNGVILENHPVLQYLYSIQRIGVVMSPLSDNGLNLPYMQNPFPVFFRRGMNVSLSTNRPLLFHLSNEPIIEEYGTASKLYRLSAIDVCEIALNSVMISSFPTAAKALWLGEAFFTEGNKGNLFELSKVPTTRLEMRQDVWQTEIQIITLAAKKNACAGDAGAVGDCCGGTNSMNATITMPVSQQMSFFVMDPHIDFPRVLFLGAHERDTPNTTVVPLLHRALELRSQYVGLHCADCGAMDAEDVLNAQEIENAFRRDGQFNEDEWMFKTVGGVIVPHEVHQIPRLPKEMPHYDDFRAHVQELRLALENIQLRDFAARRLNLLEHKFLLHVAVNRSLEAGTTAKKASQNRDFYQATKVDNNIRVEACTTARHLLNFIVSKANSSGDDIVAHQKGKEPQTLRQLLQELQISPNTLTVDDLNVQADATHGVASAQYTPEGRDELLTLLLKTDNQMKGRYFAELIKLTFENFKHDSFTFTENRLPIYGASDKEWKRLSDWFDTHGMASVHNKWMVQIPRIYSYLRKNGKVNSFAEYIENIFKPLWAVSLHPSKDPLLFHFSNHISGFDCVEDECRSDTPLHIATKAPHEWISEEEPPFNYYMYYMWANIYSLNEFRRRRNFSTFTFRPSCGEAGSIDHLIGGFLLANAINHGVTLAQDAPLQYLFYLARIGVTVCPLSNNSKVVAYLDNPFPHFFRRGLLVSLGTDSPLMFHHTQEPLLEEYSIASKVWKLAPNDMCEIARNSVLLSGFDVAFKRDRLGDLFFLSSSRSNDASRTHLSDIRVAYRFETYHMEIAVLEHISGLDFPKALLTLSEESTREAEFLEAVKKKENAPLGGVIDPKPQEADIEKLQQKRSLMQQQLQDLANTLAGLQRQNKQLIEKFSEELSRDQQAQQLRRRRMEDRREQQLETKEKLCMTAEDFFLASFLQSDMISTEVCSSAVCAGKEMNCGDGGGEEANKSSSQRLQNTPCDQSASLLSNSGSPMVAPLSTSAATMALLNHSETLWKRSSNGVAITGTTNQRKNEEKAFLPQICSSFSPSNLHAVSLKNNSHLEQKRPPTPPQRKSRDTSQQLSSGPMPYKP